MPKTYRIKDKAVTGQEIPVTKSNESWNVYQLEDGATLKIKTVLLEVVRLDEYDDNGKPIYQFNAHQVIGLDVPENLLKKPDQEGTGQ